MTLRRYRSSDVPDVKAAIQASFAELNRWMPWAQEPPTDESVRAFVEPSAENFGGDKDANYAITLTAGGNFVGSCGLMHCGQDRAVEVGYWVDSRYTGRGIATESASLLTEAAFQMEDVDQVLIRCDAANVASAKVPEKLGFRLERVGDRLDEGTGVTVAAMTWVKGR